jgi:hypothetical protein
MSPLNMVASTEPRAEAIAAMKRGYGGRIEQAFANAKTKGEAAFVTFVTAGYPSAKGELGSFSFHCYISDESVTSPLAMIYSTDIPDYTRLATDLFEGGLT